MNLRKNLSSYIALNNYVSAYRSNLGYKEVEYIEKKANELPRVVTSWKPNVGKNIHIYGSFINVSTNNKSRNLILGSYLSNNYSSTAMNIEVFSQTASGSTPAVVRSFRVYSKRYTVDSGTSEWIDYTLLENDKVDFDILTDGTTGNYTEKIVVNGNAEYSNTGTLKAHEDSNHYVCTYSMCLFNDWRITEAFSAFSFRLGKITAEEDGVKVLDLVPVVRLSDNAVGFFDNVTGEFLGNSGEGTLVAGPDVETNNIGLGHTLELKDAVNKPFESLSAYGYTEQTPEEYLDTVTAKGKCEVKKEYQTLVANGGTKQSQQTLQAKGKCGFVCVPSEYTQVESITTDGSSYINTGIEYTNYTGFDLDFSMADNTNKILGANNNSMNFYLEGSGSLICGSETSSGVVNSSSTSRQRASLINQKVTKSDGTTETITQPVVGGYAKNIYLGGINNNGDFDDGKSITIYAVRLYVKDKVVFDGVPARKEVDNEGTYTWQNGEYIYGLYDTISGKFFTNAGSGNITGGDEVFDLLPAEYTRIDYSKQNGTDGSSTTAAQRWVGSGLYRTGIVIGDYDSFKLDLIADGLWRTDTSTAGSNSYYMFQARDNTSGDYSNILGLSGSMDNKSIIGATGYNQSLTYTNVRTADQVNTFHIQFESKDLDGEGHGKMWMRLKNITAGTDHGYKYGTYDKDATITGNPKTRPSTNICLYGNNANQKITTNTRVFRAKVWKNGELVMDYVPAIRNSDSVVGFYDYVSGEFKAPSTGTLTAGEAPTQLPKEIRCNNGVIEKDATSTDHYKITPTVKETLVGFPDTEYTVLDYIESTGTQYIDSGIYFDKDTEVEMIAKTNSTGLQYLFGAQGNVMVAQQTSDSCLVLDYVDTNEQYTKITSSILGYNDFHKVEIKNYDFIVDDTVIGNFSSISGFAETTTSCVFPLRDGSKGAQLKYLKVWQSGTLVRDFEPRVRNFDGVIGLYDKVNDVFYTNAGIGKFKSDYSKFNNMTCENLLSIPSTEYFDTQDILQGIKTKRIGVKVFDGTETWTYNGSNQFYLADTTINYSSVSTGLCSHFTCISNDKSINDYTDQNVIRIGYSGNNATWAQRFLVQKPGTTSPTAFANWLASEYTAGRPVIVVYPLAKEETTHVSKPETLPENNVVLVKGALQDLELNKYEELEYITANGTQWIDTGILAASDIKAEVKFKPTNTTDTQCVLGGRTSSSSSSFSIFSTITSGEKPRFDFNSNGIVSTSTVSKTGNVFNWNVIIKDGVNNILNGEVQPSNTTATFTSSYNMYLFTVNTSNTVSTYPFNGSIAYCKIWKAGKIVRNFIPVKRKSDNVVCMYDTITCQFFENIGTGTFTAGPSILPYEYTQLEYLQGDGTTTYIDTGVYSSNLTKTVVEVKASSTNSALPVFGDFQAVNNEVGASNTLYYVSGTAGFYVTDKGGTITGTTESNKTKIGNYDTSNFHNITTDLKNRKAIFDGTETALVNTTTWTSSRTQILFARRSAYTSQNPEGLINLFSACQIKSCKIYENDVLVRDFVPARSKYSNEVGMYDRVSKKLFTNANDTGTFVEGPVLSRNLGTDIWANNGIINLHSSLLTGETTLSGTPSPSNPVSFINTKEGDVELRGINSTYADVLNVSTVTRKVGVLVLDGTENNWQEASDGIYRTTQSTLFPTDFASNPDHNIGYCSHFKLTSVSTSLASNINNGEFGWNTNGAITFRNDNFTSVDEWKAWLTGEYNAGHPVTVYYPLSTETTEPVSLLYYISGTQEQVEVEGNNLIDFDVSVMTQGYYNNTNNCWRIGSNWGYAISAPIEVIPGKTYRYSFTKQIAHDTSDNCVIGYSTLTAAQSDIVDRSATQGTKLVVCSSSGTTFGKQYGDYSYDITIPDGINYIRVTSIFGIMDDSGDLDVQMYADKDTSFRRVDISKPENLLSVSETYTDTQYVQEGEKYIKCGVKVLDPDSISGSKLKIYNAGLYIKEEATDCAIELVMASLGWKNAVGYCSHLQLSHNDIWSHVNDYPNTFTMNNSTGTSKQLHMCFANSLTGIDKSYVDTLSTTDAKIEYAKNKIRDYMVAQYNAGTPIIIVYPLRETSEETVSAVELQKNPISVEVVKASLESESLPLTYDEAYDTSDPTPAEPKDIWCNNGVINSLYSELKYLVADGHAWIKTDLSGAMRWVGAGKGTSDSSGSKCILGADELEGNAYIFLASRYASTTKYWTIKNASEGNSGVTGLTKVDYDLTYDEIQTGQTKSTFSGTIDGVYVSIENTYRFSTWNIGVCFGSSSTYGFVGNIYRQQAYKNGVLVGNFIPVKRKSDNVVGFYDTVSHTFYQSIGSSQFTAGEIVVRDYIIDGTIEKLVDNSGNEAYCEPLLKSASNFEDTQEIITGLVSRNCAIKIFDGSVEEDWKTSAWTGTNTVVYYLTDAGIKHDGTLYSSIITLCTHYKSYSRDYLNNNDVEGSGVSGLTTSTAFTFRVSRTDFPNVTAWTTWLAAQYAAGTPVMMVYPTKTTTSETVSKQILQKDPVTVQEASLEDLVVDTTKSIHTTPNPDFPLSIQNNNGTMKVMDKSNWIQIKGTTGSYGVYINPTSGINYQKWYRTNDRGCGLVIPLTVGKVYTLIIGNTTSDTGTYLRFGQSNTGPNVPTSASTGEVLLDCHILDYSKNVYHNFIAQRPYLVMQIQPGGTGTASPIYDYIVNDLLVMLEEDTVEQLVYTGKNLNDITTDIDNHAIDANGTIIDSNVSCYSAPISVVPGRTYTWSGICGTQGLISSNNKRVHGYMNDTYVTQITWEEIPKGDPFYITFTIPLGVNNIRISHCKTDSETQVEEGSRPTRYESYIQTKLPVDDLYSVSSDYTDIKNIITGNVTRKCGVLVLTGEETYTWDSSSNWKARLAVSDAVPSYPQADVAPLISNSFIASSWNGVDATTPKICLRNASAAAIAFTVGWNTDITSVETWKSYLKKKYQEGDPVIIIYPLATSTTETSIANLLSTNTSTNTVERISSTTDNLGISADYKKLK